MKPPSVTTSTPVLAGALAVGAGIFVGVDTAVNHELTGARLVLALLLEAVALLLFVESATRAHANKGWRHLTGIGIILGVGSIVLVVGPTVTKSPGDELRLAVGQTTPGLFNVALPGVIGLPTANEGWPSLHSRGAIDVERSLIDMRLGNKSNDPLTINNIRAEVVGTSPAPTGTSAVEYSQGEEGLAHFVFLISSGRLGSISKLYESTTEGGDVGVVVAETRPYFENKYIRLPALEVYPATITVETKVPMTVSYRLIVEGSSASGEFVTRSPTFKIVGMVPDSYSTRFQRYYVKGHAENACTPTPANPWVNGTPSAHSAACPHGLGLPYEAPPLKLKKPAVQRVITTTVHAERDAQSVTLGGVLVGRPPAAGPVSNVVPALIRSLGPWERCMVYDPNVNDWTATWDESELNVTFSGDSARYCNPASMAHVVEVAGRSNHEALTSNFGAIALGAQESSLPRALRDAAIEFEDGHDSKNLVLSGVKPCDATSPDNSRFHAAEHTRAGILTLGVEVPSKVVSRFSITLPHAGCKTRANGVRG